MKSKPGFSLIEVILSIGVFSLIVSLIIGLSYSQSSIEQKNNELVEQMEIIDDFCSFVAMSEFNFINKLSNSNSVLHVLEAEENGVLFRRFISNDEWQQTNANMEKKYVIKLETINDLFSSEDSPMKTSIPLMCKLYNISKNKNNEILDKLNKSDYFTFVTTKSY